MAWRIDEAVEHGEIDNTIPGKTTGRIWLAGHDAPLVLSLNGDCWRDLAGTRLKFENPVPKPIEDASLLDADQTGVIGDMTASRKNKVPLVDEEEFGRRYLGREEIPFEWKNTLYLEWFSEINGRVVIETTEYKLTISEREWEMDEDDEQAQKLANLNAMRDFMAQVIRRRDPDSSALEDFEDMDEFAWEERLKESDRLTDAYQEVLEKYMEDEDSERKEAFVMGWDGLLEALAEREESGTWKDGEFADESDSDGPDEDSHLQRDEEKNHPLQKQAQELALRSMDLMDREADEGSAAYKLISNLLQVSGKLAGALHGHGEDYEPEKGFVLAVLKRCLGWLNEAIGSCQELLEIERNPEQFAALEQVRVSIFEIRDGIVALRHELKQS